MVEQIKLVATGWYASVGVYLQSANWRRDTPGTIVQRDGTMVDGGGQRWVVAIENAGEVVLDEGLWYPAVWCADGKLERIPCAPSVRAPYEYCTCKLYHGCQYYEMICGKQLKALRQVLLLLMAEFGMSFPYDNQLGAICPRAIEGGSGIYFASSYDNRRSDLHPQIELLNLIKSLAS